MGQWVGRRALRGCRQVCGLQLVQALHARTRQRLSAPHRWEPARTPGHLGHAAHREAGVVQPVPAWAPQSQPMPMHATLCIAMMLRPRSPLPLPARARHAQEGDSPNLPQPLQPPTPQPPAQNPPCPPLPLPRPPPTAARCHPGAPGVRRACCGCLQAGRKAGGRVSPCLVMGWPHSVAWRCSTQPSHRLTHACMHPDQA